jgi:hypothetical protein
MEDIEVAIESNSALLNLMQYKKEIQSLEIALKHIDLKLNTFKLKAVTSQRLPFSSSEIFEDLSNAVERKTLKNKIKILKARYKELFVTNTNAAFIA